jgi:hypothetical protein
MRLTQCRLKGWERRLAAVVARHRELPFAWGASDCFLLPLDAIVALTGRDPWSGLHDYSSRLSAARRLAAQGYSSLADAFADKLAEIPPALAQRGDVGVVEDGGALCGALVAAAGFVGKSEAGLVSIPRERVQRAFRVA